MYHNPARYAAIPLGVVVRRSPGATRWARWVWTVPAVLPGAAQAEWKVMRHEGDVTEFHAATVSLELHGADAEAYLQGLSVEVPSIYVVLRPDDEGPMPYTVHAATASPFEAQDYCDNSEDIVEKVPMPEGLIAFVRDFTLKFHEEEPFKKRKRDRQRVDVVEDGKGDARIRQLSDVYRAPVKPGKGRLQ